MTGFTAALILLGLVLLILAGLYTVSQVLEVARPAPPAAPFAGGLPSAEHAVSRYHVRWYAVTMLFLAFDMEMIFMYPWALVTTPGAIAVRLAAEEQLRRLGWPTALTPADADILLVAGYAVGPLADVVEATSSGRSRYGRGSWSWGRRPRDGRHGHARRRADG